MTDDEISSTQPDPREERFVVDTDLLTEDQISGLVDEYCTRSHGLNDSENPLDERTRVLAAVRRGELVVWFDPVENTAGLGVPAN
ncbi:hypothetical protein LPB19_12415 [Marinobacter salinisoli]|uniref:YheU family protein n=1 Tax=Marinobacter salinisoli TaxID=2769486 RepID=A0ABX7MUQ5_9GAMM|nr:hypothetical protein [Marinobacter salinisoli]QSP93993.1 hypothetical protein LPB19_12415 [Marinobacter salinisoli]